MLTTRTFKQALTGFRVPTMSVHQFPVIPRVEAIASSIWEKYGKMARENQAVNLGQGFSDDVIPEVLAKELRAVAADTSAVYHQYAPGSGHPVLLNVLSKMYTDYLGWKVEPQQHVLITVGAYLSLYYTIMSWINNGERVIIIEPAYDCYATQVKMAGGLPIGVVLEEKITGGVRTTDKFELNFDALEAQLKKSPTKVALILNNPHNPLGKVFSETELLKIAHLAEKYNLLVIADEVYEYQVMDKPMIRFASLPNMANRTVTIGSGGKCFSCTGWKLGWVVAPSHLIDPIKKYHAQAVFTCSAPTQAALGNAFEQEYTVIKEKSSKSYLLETMPAELRRKRDKLSKALTEAGFEVVIPEGGIFVIVDYKSVWNNVDHNNTEKPDEQFARWLTVNKKLAVIPCTPFYLTEGYGTDYVRFCFNKTDKVLDEAIAILKTLKK